MKSRTITSGLALAATLLAGGAAAHKQYPPRIARDLRLAADPSCQICHRGKETSTTAVQPFVLVLRQLGLPKAVDLDALSAVLVQDEDCNVDSDGDGTTDIQELKNGTNPSDGSGPATFSCGEGGPSISLVQAPEFETGCSVGRGRATERPGASAAVLASLVVLLVTRRSRRSSPFRHR